MSLKITIDARCPWCKTEKKVPVKVGKSHLTGSASACGLLTVLCESEDCEHLYAIEWGFDTSTQSMPVLFRDDDTDGFLHPTMKPVDLAVYARMHGISIVSSGNYNPRRNL